MLNSTELEKLVDEVKKEIENKIIIANRCGDLEEYLKRIGYTKEEEYFYCEPHTSKVLVLGQSSVKKNDLIKIIKQLGKDPKRFEFILEYDDCKNYPMDTLKGNTKYSDILLGPMPHKTNKMGDCSSIIAEIKNNQQDYPKTQVMSANGSIKITKESFKEALQNTQYASFGLMS